MCVYAAGKSANSTTNNQYNHIQVGQADEQQYQEVDPAYRRWPRSLCITGNDFTSCYSRIFMCLSINFAYRRCVKRPKITINVNKRVYREKITNVSKRWHFFKRFVNSVCSSCKFEMPVLSCSSLYYISCDVYWNNKRWQKQQTRLLKIFSKRCLYNLVTTFKPHASYAMLLLLNSLISHSCC